MINRIKLEHILEYARQQRHIGQHCKIPPGDMVEIMEIAMRKAGNSPVTPDGWISCSERMPEKYDFDIWVFSPFKPSPSPLNHSTNLIPLLSVNKTQIQPSSNIESKVKHT
ncbi:DUF551 domain-containing protein, partial [Escherichia coli]|uniref:DUF551 domain-containing protein n=1 Tax=Escherichia coli TaxID=562 RepID=UPI00201A5AD2